MEWRRFVTYLWDDPRNIQFYCIGLICSCQESCRLYHPAYVVCLSPKSIMLAGPKPVGDLCASWSQTCVNMRVVLLCPKSTTLASPKTCLCVAYMNPI